MEGAGGQGTRVSKPWLHCCKCKPRCSSPLTPRIPSKPTGPLCPLRAEKAAHEARQAKSRALGDDEDEEELMKQRERDDWNDTNKRGWGNSALRPCGR